MKPVTNVAIKKHTCVSLYIDGHKSLKSLTQFSADSSYGADTTVSDYLINTGNGVVGYEYIYSTNVAPYNQYQSDFDQLATSTKVK